MALSAAHRRFVEAYRANGGDGAAAAHSAGYAGEGNALKASASKLLARGDIQAELAELADSTDNIDQDEREPIASKTEREEFWTMVMRGLDEAGKPAKIGMRDRLEASRILSRVQGDLAHDDDPPNADEVDALRFVPLRADDDLDDKSLNAALAGAAVKAPDAPRRK